MKASVECGGAIVKGKEMKKASGGDRGMRIASKVQTLVGEILRDKYPEMNITLTDAQSSGGLQFVRLYYQGDRNLQKRLDEITRAVRFELAARLDQRYVPEIRFAYDDTLERAQRIENLLKDL